ETKLSIHPEYDRAETGLSEKEFLILDALQVQEELTLKEVSEIVGIKTIQPLIKGLIEKKCAIVSEELNTKYTPKYATYVEISKSIFSEEQLTQLLNELENQPRSEKQVAALLKTVELTNWDNGKKKPVLKRNVMEAGIAEASRK